MKKLLTLILTLGMLCTSFTGVMAYSDVKADTYVSEAVSVLTGLDILEGYEDGTFKPEGTITRAEMAKIICKVLGYDHMGQNKTPFNDVEPKHWAAGYINTAYDLGIINGYGDGNFGPEDTITYEQAVKMLVGALGYEKKAQSMGGYPTGYMMVANQEGITSNTSNVSNRGTVAVLTYNALTVPMMDQTSWGTNEQFNAVPTQSLLYSKLDAIKADVVINEIPLNKEDETVELTYKKLDKVAAANGIETETNVKINGVDLAGLQGLNATAIIDISDSDWKLLAVVGKAGKNASVVVDPALITNLNDNGYLTYKKNADDDRDSKFKVVADELLNIYVNLVKNNSYDFTDTNDIAYTYVDTDNNGVYDTVFVQNTAVFVVGSVNVKSNKIYRDTDSGSMSTYGPAVITLDPENDNIDWVLYNADGKEIKLSDVKAGSVAAVSYSADGAYEYYNITFYNDTVKGDVEQLYTENGKKYYTINGYDYTMLDANYTLTPGDEIVAKVYGDKIVSYDVKEGVRNYGVVLATNTDTDFDTTYQLQVLTSTGKITTLELADKVNGIVYNGTNFDTDFATDDVITYELNSKGEIKAYNTVRTVYNTNGSYKASSEKLDSYYITNNTTVVITENAKGSNDKTTVFVGSTDIFDETEIYDYTVVYDENKEAEFVVLYQAANQVNMNSDPIFITKVATTTIAGDSREKYTGYVNGELVEYTTAEDIALDLNKNDVAMFATNAKGEITNVIVLADYEDGVYTVMDTDAADDSKVSNVATEWTVSSTGVNNVNTTSIKGFATVGKAYTVKGRILRLVNIADLDSIGVDGDLRDYGVNEEYITDVSINPSTVAYSVNTTTDKVKITAIADAETDINTNDYRTPGQTDNGDYVYVYNYDGETKLVLIINTDND